MKRFIITICSLAMALINVTASETNTNAVPQWTVPADWKEIPPGPAMVKAYFPSLSTNDIIVVTVQRIGPGSVVHRERKPLDLPTFEMVGDTRKPIRATVTLPDPNDRATMIDMLGMDSQSHVSRRRIFIKVLRPNENEEWLYQIVGDAAPVKLQKDTFIRFVQSAHYP